jgi:hypothetical protein
VRHPARRAAITDPSDELRRAARRALSSRIAAELAAVTSDSTVTVERPAGTESVRSLVFTASDHECRVLVYSTDVRSVHATVDAPIGYAQPVEMWIPDGVASSALTDRQGRASFGSIPSGPVRFTYAFGSAGRRVQTEWILLH